MRNRDFGFRVLRLDEIIWRMFITCLKSIRRKCFADETNIKPDRTDLDLLFLSDGMGTFIVKAVLFGENRWLYSAIIMTEKVSRLL